MEILGLLLKKHILWDFAFYSNTQMLCRMVTEMSVQMSQVMTSFEQSMKKGKGSVPTSDIKDLR